MLECIEYDRRRNGSGYGILADGRLAHRAAWEEIHGAIPSGQVIRHACDHPPCIRPSHLRIGSQRDNVEDKMRNDERRILTPNERQNLLLDWVAEERQTEVELADKYGIPATYVNSVLKIARREGQRVPYTRAPRKTRLTDTRRYILELVRDNPGINSSRTIREQRGRYWSTVILMREIGLIENRCERKMRTELYIMEKGRKALADGFYYTR